jgi:hypothetical protein
MKAPTSGASSFETPLARLLRMRIVSCDELAAEPIA